MLAENEHDAVIPLILWHRGASRSGYVSSAHVAELMLPQPTCSQCALQRKASHRHRARTFMIYEPSVASDVPVA